MLQAVRSGVSIPDEVTGFYGGPNPSSLDSASNEYQESSLGGGGGKIWPVRRADNLAAICEPNV
jgi:hypothetical protein